MELICTSVISCTFYFALVFAQIQRINLDHGSRMNSPRVQLQRACHVSTTLFKLIYWYAPIYLQFVQSKETENIVTQLLDCSKTLQTFLIRKLVHH